jgi:cardiolipin synthase
VVEEPQARPSSRRAGVDAHPIDHSHDIYTAANVITILRLILVPFFFAVFIRGQNDVVSFLLFAVAASTDWLDGQLARRTGTVTVIGKAIDPLVDRLLIVAGVLGLFLVGRLPAWVVALLVLRDTWLLYGAWHMEHFHHKRLAVTYLGKVTTAVLLLGFSDLILNWPKVAGMGLVDSRFLPGLGSHDAAVGILLVYVGVVLSVLAATQYTVAAAHVAAESRAAR